MIFRDIVEYLRKDDLLVLNNTKVVPARLYGKKETGGKVEVLLLGVAAKFTLPASREFRQSKLCSYSVLIKPVRGIKIGTKLIFGNGELKAEVTRIENDRRFLRFECNGNFDRLLERLGEMPLPPYIKRRNVSSDKERYQTVYASEKGAVAAPTAGLHFTSDILSNIAEKEVDIEYVTLHVGYGTFKPVKCEDVKRHEMEKEYFEIEDEVIDKLKSRKNRTIAVGTTACRVLETVAAELALPDAKQALQLHYGWTDLFIYPPYKFKAIDALLTNFHLPRTTLLMLVSAFCRRKLLLKAYEEAIEKKYRFYSYGDAMLIT